MFDIKDLAPKYHSKFKSFLKDSKPEDILKNCDNNVLDKLMPKKGYINYDLWDKLVMTFFIEEYIVPDNIEIKLLKELKNKIKKQNETSLDNNYIWNSLVRNIIDYFIKDVTLHSFQELEKINNNYINRFKENYPLKFKLIHRTDLSLDYNYSKGTVIKRYFDSKIINCSESACKFNRKLEEYIKYQILNSYNVNRFDGKAIFIVRQLFKAYYSNPRQMPKETLDKLSQRLKENSANYRNKLILTENTVDEIKFKTSPPKDINGLLKLLKLEMSKEELEKIFKTNYPKEHDLNLNEDFLKSINGDLSFIDEKYKKCDDKFHEKIIEKIFEKINSLNKGDIEKEDDEEKRSKMLFLKCLLEHHYIYLSLICDHIAGMTDNYAENEYRKLYLV